MKLMFVDVRKAHLNGKLQDDELACIQLPVESGGGVVRLFASDLQAMGIVPKVPDTD